MKEKIISFESLNIDPCYAFICSDEEIEAAERKEAARAEELKAVFFAPDFIAAEHRTESGAREILHRSTRPGVYFQLSYIAADGVPTLHENYIKTEEKQTAPGCIDKIALFLSNSPERSALILCSS